eukprot:12415110-Karenia_brevis.AAC.1
MHVGGRFRSYTKTKGFIIGKPKFWRGPGGQVGTKLGHVGPSWGQVEAMLGQIRHMWSKIKTKLAKLDQDRLT